MATHFDRWEKDPFFPAAEEVQDSADRMESTYRKWVISNKDKSPVCNSDDLRRDLRTALGTTKWQLDDFERAVNSSYTNNSAEDAKDRHLEFATAINSQIKKVESSLNESAVSQGMPPLPWVRLDEKERNELALFLSGSSSGKEKKTMKLEESDNESMPECSNNSSYAVEWGQGGEAKDEKLLGHRRTASASAGIGSWNIAVKEDVPERQPEPPPWKVPSFSGFLNSMEFATQLTLSRNGYRKLKVTDGDGEGNASLPHSRQLSKDTNKFYERNESCHNSADESCDKQLYGLYGAIQRQLQRSQYYMQYNRPVRVVALAILLFCLIVLVVLQVT